MEACRKRSQGCGEASRFLSFEMTSSTDNSKDFVGGRKQKAERDDWEVNKPDLDLSTSVEFLRDFTSGEIKQRELKEETCLGFFFVDALEDGLELRIAIGELWRCSYFWT